MVIFLEHDYLRNYPAILAEWDYEKNLKLGKDPLQLTCGIITKFWWICPTCQMSYDARIPDRVKKNSGCPYCSGRKPIPGISDLETWCIQNNRNELLDECLPELNHGKTPSQYRFASNKVITWKCRFCGHQYPKQIDQRTLRHFGCKECYIKGTSFPEQFIFFALKSVQKETFNRYKVLGSEVDVYIPSLKLCIEYNGEYYHSSKRDAADQKKKAHLEGSGYTFLLLKNASS